MSYLSYISYLSYLSYISYLSYLSVLSRLSSLSYTYFVLLVFRFFLVLLVLLAQLVLQILAPQIFKKFCRCLYLCKKCLLARLVDWQIKDGPKEKYASMRQRDRKTDRQNDMEVCIHSNRHKVNWSIAHTSKHLSILCVIEE